VVIGIGGLGHVGLQALSALSAAKIIAVDISREALTFAEELGADHVVRASDHTVDDVMALTGGGAAVVLDFVAEHDVPQAALTMLRTGGNYLVVGYGGELRTPTMAIMGQEKRVTGNVGGTHDELVELLALAAESEVRLHVREYALDDVNEALDDLSKGRIRGRGVLVPSATT
jgi:NAD+-dependent secondary alcohol dehydrogenase Adh1